MKNDEREFDVGMVDRSDNDDKDWDDYKFTCTLVEDE